MEINVQQLKEKLTAKEGFILIDVREPYEHQEFNVGGKLIPLGTITSAIPELETYKDKEVVVYCRSGQRSGMAQQLLQKAGFTKVFNLKGGVIAWAEVYGI